MHFTTLNKSTVKKTIKGLEELSKIGFSGYGVKKVNQDNLFIVKNFMDEPDNIYLAVWYIYIFLILVMGMV